VSEFERHLVAAKAGDEEAFGRLFRSTQPLLLRYLRTLGGPLAEDCASDTWLSVVSGLDRFEGDEAGWRAWVFTIGRRRLVDTQRRLARGDLLVDDVMSLAETGDGAVSDVASTVEEGHATAQALALLRQLPAEQREAVFLRHVAGLDVKQTAEVLGRTPGSVRVATHRGLRRLQERLPRSPTAVTSDNADVPTSMAR
jgi:RNA polymerase sigma-70 factor (ECF subfamily)